jgi:hypothetical protein
MIKMFQSFNIFGRKQQGSAHAVIDELPVMLNMPAGFHGKTVPASIVVMELLWQQYGLDMLHPEVSRWLEQHAPDIKYAVAESRFASSNDCTMFKVGPKGTIELHLSLKVDDRLREIASQYILSQVQHYDEITEEHQEAEAMPPASVPQFEGPNASLKCRDRFPIQSLCSHLP